MNRIQTDRRSMVHTLIASAIAAGTWNTTVAARPGSADTGGDNGARDETVRITFLFGHPEDVEAFETHYEAIHLPLVVRVPGLVHMESCRSSGNLDGSTSSFYRVNTLTFRNHQDLLLAAESNEGLAALADLERFASGGVSATVVQGITDFDPPLVTTRSRLRNGVDPRQP